jgi:Arc/MetJ-type ribon-helix-helix transcriptional regulator
MATSISVSNETRDKLMKLRIEGGFPNMDALIRDMLILYRKERFFRDSREFKRRMEEKGYKPEDLV